MESNLSGLSSLKEDDTPVYIQPHYRESYRLAIYALLCGGKEAYEEFLRAEQISHLLSEDEIFFILENAEVPVVEDDQEDKRVQDENSPSTYFPTESDEEVPDLELGWPEVSLEGTDTSISLLFHPPRQSTPTIKEVVRKQIQEAKQVIAIAMDVFTDVDIFKEIITATLRGVVVYILLDQSHFKSFLNMTRRVGVNIQDLKNIRVRTVQGQQYQCQSGAKFHGDLEQKFLLVDCRTVLYGTYSYTWSFEKINLSMVLVITGQLVCTYDEEFRRLYARSTVPPVKSSGNSSARYASEPVAMQSPNSSQLSLHQIHMRSKGMHGVWSAQDDRANNVAMLTRGLSVQERLHQSHCLDVGNLVRGHSYGGELQKLATMTRLRMGTKDFGVPAAPERSAANLRGGDTLTNRLSQQHLRHRTRYGPDQNLIPFNSETSLHRWKMDAYLNNSDMPLDASCDAISPLASPYSSHTGLNEHQTQLVHSRSRDIKSRMEEMRQKRFSLQEYANHRQSQESIKSMYSALDRPKFMPSLRGVDMTVAEFDSNAQNGEPANHKDSEPKKEGGKREQTEGHRSASQNDVKAASDRRKLLTYDWRDPLSRTTSADDMKLNDPSLKFGLGIQQPRAMESLTEIPEEKEGSNTRVNSSDSVAPKDRNDEIRKDEKVAPKENAAKPNPPAESAQPQDQARENHVGKVANSSGSPTPRARKKSVPSEVQTDPKTLDASTGSPEAKTHGHMEKGQTQSEETTLQRKNSLRMKMYSLISPDEKKASKKEDKTLQRKGSLRLKNPSGSNQPLRADHSQAADQAAKKGQSPSVSRSQTPVSSPVEAEKPKSPFPRLSAQRSSKKKTNPAAEQDRGSGSTLDDEGAAAYQREKVYSRFEYFLNPENSSRDKSTRHNPSDKDKSSSLNRHDYAAYQTQGGTDNKLGRFMQRMGNLISKNK